MSWEAFTTRSGIAGWRRGSGPRLAVVLHGGPGLGDYTQELADEVLAADPDGLTVARYQQRGQAPSTPEGDLTVAQAATDFVDVVRELGFESAVVVGHSWGGHLSFHLAADVPDAVAALLVIDPLGAVDDGGMGDMGRIIPARMSDQAKADLAAAIADEGASEHDKAQAQLRAIWACYFVDPASAPPPPEIDYDRRVEGGYMGDAVPMLTNGTVAKKLGDVRVPAHFVLGSASPIPPVHGERSAALIEGATTTTIEAGHFVWVEQPGAVTHGMRTVLGRL